jgi:hypothetical protein
MKLSDYLSDQFSSSERHKSIYCVLYIKIQDVVLHEHEQWTNFLKLCMHVQTFINSFLTKWKLWPYALLASSKFMMMLTATGDRSCSLMKFNLLKWPDHTCKLHKKKFKLLSYSYIIYRTSIWRNLDRASCSEATANDESGEPRWRTIYYMGKDILLATKTLVESICHYIRDPSGVFSLCHAREWHIDKFPPVLLLLYSKWSTSSRFVELSEDDIYHLRATRNVNFLVIACFYCKCLLVI